MSRPRYVGNYSESSRYPSFSTSRNPVISMWYLGIEWWIMTNGGKKKCDSMEAVRKDVAVCNTEIKCWIFVYRREELCTRCNNASVKSLEKLRDRFPRTHTRSNIHRERADVCGCQAKGKRDRTSVLGLMQLLISLVKLQSITLELCVVTCD